MTECSYFNQLNRDQFTTKTGLYRDWDKTKTLRGSSQDQSRAGPSQDPDQCKSNTAWDI